MIAMIFTIVFGVLSNIWGWFAYPMWVCLVYVFVFCMVWMFIGIKNKIKDLIG